MLSEIQKTYGTQFEPELIHELNQFGKLVEVPSGETLLDIGSYIRSIPLLLSGVLKILREDTEGDELLLYYLEEGQTCSMTMACCMGHTKSEVRAIAETNAALILVPITKMEEWLASYKSWRNYVFSHYHYRLNELLHTVDSIAFTQMDTRLLAYLKKKAEVTNSNTVKGTHQEIAYDLHTSRVVVSRLLKRLEKMKMVEIHRNHIIIKELNDL